jgi:hypothetical protein
VDGCRACGFDYDTTGWTAAQGLVVDGAADIGGLIVTAGQNAGTRPAPSIWSPLEYACHVRDVLLVQRERTLLALVEDNPSFAPMYRDERAVDARYSVEESSRVASQLSTAADLLVWVFDRLDPRQLARPCVYNYPEPTQRQIGWLMVHTAHEVVHHQGDIRHVLGKISP